MRYLWLALSFFGLLTPTLSANNYIWLAASNQYYHSCVIPVHKETLEVKKVICDNLWHIVNLYPHPKKDSVAIIDKNQKSLIHLSAEGKIIFKQGNDESSLFSSPWSVAIDYRNDYFYVLDSYHNHIVKLGPKGQVLDLFRGFNFKQGGLLNEEMIMDYVNGYIWVANRFGPHYQIGILNSYGLWYSQISGLTNPFGLAINQRNGYVAVSDKKTSMVFTDFKDLQGQFNVDKCLDDSCLVSKESKTFFSRITANEENNSFWVIEGGNKIVEIDYRGEKLRTITGLENVNDISYNNDKKQLWVASSSIYNAEYRKFMILEEDAPDGYKLTPENGDFHKIFDLTLNQPANANYPYQPIRIAMTSPEISKQQPLKIKGQVTLDNVIPLEQVRVQIAEFPEYQTQLDSEGHFTLTVETPGFYVVEVTAPCYQTKRFSVALSKEQSEKQLPLIQLEKGNPVVDFEHYRSGYSMIADFEWGQPKGPMGCHSGIRCMGTGIKRSYSPRSNSSLFTPGLNISEMESPHMSLWTWHNTEKNDGGQVNIVILGTLVPIEPIEKYPASTVKALGNRPGFAGVSNGWKKYTFDLTNFKPFAPVSLVFNFQSDDNVQNWGWYVDDISIYDAKGQCR